MNIPFWTCRRMERLISRSLDGALSRRETQALTSHLAICDACRTRHAEFQTLRGELLPLGVEMAAQASRSPAAGHLAGRALAQARSGEGSDNATHYRRPVFATTAAAGVTLATALAAGALYLSASREAVAPQDFNSNDPRIVVQKLSSPPSVLPPTTPIRKGNGLPTRVAAHPRSVEPRSHFGIEATPLTSYASHTAEREQQHRSDVPSAAQPRAVAMSPVDDLRYVNTDPASFARRWTRLAPAESDALEAQLQASVRGGDDFVEVPLPRLASMDRKTAVQAAESYKRQREIVDARLQRKVALAVKGGSFAEFCEQLSRETGVTIEASKGVADDKITAFCKDRPVRDIMRAVADVFNYYWERFGEEGAYRYRLVQPLRSQLLEEELRNRARNEALLALDREMGKYKEFMDLSPDQANERAKTTTDPAQRELLETLGGPQAAAARLYFGLGQDEMAVLLSGQELSYASFNEPGKLPLPADLAAVALRGTELKEGAFIEPLPDGNYKMHRRGQVPPSGSIPLSAYGGSSAYASLRLDYSDLGQMRLEGGGGYRVAGGSKDSQNVYVSVYGDTLAAGTSPSAKSPKNAEANSALANRSALQTPVKLPSAEKPVKLAAASSKKTASYKTSADILEAFHRATGKDVIGDYYTRLYEPGVLEDGSIAGKESSLFEVLCRVSDKARLRWGMQDEWLTFRSATFFNDRLQEVPKRLLDRWAAARTANNGRMPLASLLEMGSLTDAQLDGREMARGASELYDLQEWGAIAHVNLRPTLRFVASLPPSLRTAAQTETGLRFDQLPLGQQQEFSLLTFGKDSQQTLTQEDFAGATLRVELPGGPDNKDPKTKDRPFVRFTYQYGNERIGRTHKVLTPGGTSTSNDGPNATRLPLPEMPH